MSDLWSEASRDIEAENALRRLTAARVAATSVWPFLAEAKSIGEFDNRLALVEARMTEAADGDDELTAALTASFRQDFGTLRSYAMREAAMKRVAEDTYEDGKGTCDLCGKNGTDDDPIVRVSTGDDSNALVHRSEKDQVNKTSAKTAMNYYKCNSCGQGNKSTNAENKEYCGRCGSSNMDAVDKWDVPDAISAQDKPKEASKTAGKYCKTHQVWVGEGNASNHDAACKMDKTAGGLDNIPEDKKAEPFGKSDGGGDGDADDKGGKSDDDADDKSDAGGLDNIPDDKQAEPFTKEDGKGDSDEKEASLETEADKGWVDRWSNASPADTAKGIGRTVKNMFEDTFGDPSKETSPKPLPYQTQASWVGQWLNATAAANDGESDAEKADTDADAPADGNAGDDRETDKAKDDADWEKESSRSRLPFDEAAKTAATDYRGNLNISVTRQDENGGVRDGAARDVPPWYWSVKDLDAPAERTLVADGYKYTEPEARIAADHAASAYAKGSAGQAISKLDVDNLVAFAMNRVLAENSNPFMPGAANPYVPNAPGIGDLAGDSSGNQYMPDQSAEVSTPGQSQEDTTPTTTRPRVTPTNSGGGEDNGYGTGTPTTGVPAGAGATPSM